MNINVYAPLAIFKYAVNIAISLLKYVGLEFSNWLQTYHANSREYQFYLLRDWSMSSTRHLYGFCSVACLFWIGWIKSSFLIIAWYNLHGTGNLSWNDFDEMVIVLHKINFSRENLKSRNPDTTRLGNIKKDALQCPAIGMTKCMDEFVSYESNKQVCPIP